MRRFKFCSFFGLLVLVLFFGCQQKEPFVRESEKLELKPVKMPTPKYKNVREVASNRKTLNVWLSKDFYPNLSFRNQDSVSIEFSGQCQYKFPIVVKENTIEVIFDPKENCGYDLGIGKNFKLKEFPKKGKPFLVLGLVNDSTLVCGHVYETWKDSVNAMNRNYPAFVSEFRSKRLD